MLTDVDESIVGIVLAADGLGGARVATDAKDCHSEYLMIDVMDIRGCNKPLMGMQERPTGTLRS